MNTKLEKHLLAAQTIDKQRRAWLVLSALVIVVLGIIVFDGPYLNKMNIQWTVGSICLILTVVWWYWVMNLAYKVIKHRLSELELLDGVCVDMLEVKTELEALKKLTK